MRLLPDNGWVRSSANRWCDPFVRNQPSEVGGLGGHYRDLLIVNSSRDDIYPDDGARNNIIGGNRDIGASDRTVLVVEALYICLAALPVRVIDFLSE